jgi:carboxymethylenebutenolidase
MGKIVEFSKPTGGSAKGYLASAEGAASGVIVIQEWWGLNDQICGVADRFARAGYNAIAPDLYDGRVTQDPDEANHMMSGLDFPGAVQDIRGAVQYLKANGCSKVAVMGFCMGGALTIASAVHIPEMDAGVCYYGIPPKELAEPKDIKPPMQYHFATIDDWCTPDAVNALEEDLKAAGLGTDIYRYEAGHGFFNERRGDVYNAEASQQTWDRMMDFLSKNL